MDKFGEIIFYIKSVHNEIGKKRNIILAKYDITGTQCDIIEYLYKNSNNEIYQKDLENFFNQSNPSMTGLLNRLERKNFIIRKISIKDCRYKEIILTNKTYELLLEIKKDLLTFSNSYNKILSENEKEYLINLLKKLYLNINN